MRQRLLSPGFFHNEDLTKLPPLTRIAFAGLWCMADKEGRVEDRPRRLRVQIFPYELLTDEAFDDLLADLHQGGFVQRYEAEASRYLSIPNFQKYQRPHPKERESVIPAPCESPEISRLCRVKVLSSQAGPSVSFVPSVSSGSSGPSGPSPAATAAGPDGKARRSRANHGTAAQRAALDKCSELLGRKLSYSKSNVDAIVRAEANYTGEQVARVLRSVRDGSTPSGMWCKERLGSGLPLEVILRPGGKGSADKILEQLQNGDHRAPLVVQPSEKARQHRHRAEVFMRAGLVGDGSVPMGDDDARLDLDSGNGAVTGLLQGPGSGGRVGD